MTGYTDVSAWICYLGIFAVSTVVSFYHIKNKTTAGAHGLLWMRFEIWFVYLAYVCSPVLLFWLLDLTGELPDTSLIIAIIVALTYRKILAGNGPTQAPGVLAGYWISLEKIVDGLINSSADQLHAFRAWQRRAHLRHLYDLDEARSEKLIKLAERLGVQTPDSKNWRSWRQFCDDVYFELFKEHRNASADFLVEEEVMEWFEKFKYRLQPARLTRLLVPLVAVTLAVFGLVNVAFRADLELAGTYLSWRIGKPNASASDLHRTRTTLGRLLNPQTDDDGAGDGETTRRTVEMLIAKLDAVGIPSSRAAVIEELIRANRASIRTRAPDTVERLANTLRTQRPEIRSLVHKHLLFLAGNLRWSVPDHLQNWNPATRLAIPQLERNISDWYQFSQCYRDSASCGEAPPNKASAGQRLTDRSKNSSPHGSLPRPQQ